MSVVYEWEIIGIKTKTEGSNEDSVVVVEWLKRVFDAEGNQAEFYGTTPLTSINSESFLSFDTLNEATVLSWVQAEVDDEQLNITLLNQLSIVADPAVSRPLPW